MSSKTIADGDNACGDRVAVKLPNGIDSVRLRRSDRLPHAAGQVSVRHLT